MSKVRQRKLKSSIGIKKISVLKTIKDATSSMRYPKDDFPKEDLSQQYRAFKLEAALRMQVRAEAQNLAVNDVKLALKRQKQHDDDLMVQEHRRKWFWGDPMDCWERTEEEIDFGIYPEIPKEPEDISRFDLLDVEE